MPGCISEEMAGSVNLTDVKFLVPIIVFKCNQNYYANSLNIFL